MLGVMHWQRNQQQFWGVGGGVMALGRQQLRFSSAFVFAG
jgi:hypothetical protein